MIHIADFLYEMIAKIESGIKSMDETGSVSWIVEKFQMSQQNRWSGPEIRKTKNKSTSKEIMYGRTGKEH